MRDEAVEEGYITRAKGDDRPRTKKEAQVGQARLAEISCADLVQYGRFVLSLALVLANRSVVFAVTPSIPLLPPVH
jgi:hypothetical protein